MQQSSEKLENLPLALNGDPDDRQSLLSRAEFLRIVDARDNETGLTTLIEIGESRGRIETEILAFGGWCSCEKLIKDVVVALRLGLVDQSRSLEQISSDASPDDSLGVVEEDLE